MRSATRAASIWAAVPLAVLPLFVAAMLLVPAAGVGDDVPAGVGADGDRVAGAGADRAHPPRGPLGAVVLRGDDPARLRRDPARADGAVGGGRSGPVRRPDASARRCTRRGVRADAGRVRVEGRPAAAARLAAARAPGGAEPGVGADERGDGQPRASTASSAIDLQLLGPGPALVGGDAAGRRRGVRGVRRAAGVGGDGSQTAACLFDDREHGADHPRPRARRRCSRLRGARRRRRSRWPRRCCTWSRTPRSRASGSWPPGRCWPRPGCAIWTGSAAWPAGCPPPRYCSGWPRSARPGCRWAPGSSASGCWSSR